MIRILKLRGCFSEFLSHYESVSNGQSGIGSQSLRAVIAAASLYVKIYSIWVCFSLLFVLY